MKTTERQHVRGQIHAMWIAAVFGVLCVFCVLVTGAAAKDPFSVAIGAGVIAACAFISVSFFRISKQEERLAADRRILAPYESAITAFLRDYEAFGNKRVIHDLEFWIIRAVKSDYERRFGKDVVMAFAATHAIRWLDTNKYSSYEEQISRQILGVSVWISAYYRRVPGFKARSYREYQEILRGENRSPSTSE